MHSTDFPGALERKARRLNTAPACYLGHPARPWITVMRPHRRGSASHHPVQAVTGEGRTPFPARRLCYPHRDRNSLRDAHRRALAGHLADDPGAGMGSPCNQ